MGEVVQLRRPAVAVWGPITKVALVMFVLCQVSSLAYLFFFRLMGLNMLVPMLQDAHIDQIFAFENQLLQVTFSALAYALLTAISPLVGWWVYSRVDTGGQAKVMWGSAALFTVASAIFNIVLTGGAIITNPVAMVLGLAILIFYIVFFMGLGFVPAQIFKLKL